MKIKVVNQRLYLEPPETAEGTREYLRAEFSFSEEWDGMTKTAFFRGADGENHPKLLKDNVCTVPAEALAVPGRVGVSVSGTLGETVITTDIKSFSVPATLSGGTPSDPEPTVWQQILDKVDETQQIAQSVRDDADAGKFAATAEMVEQAVSVFMAGFSPEHLPGKILGRVDHGRTAGSHPGWQLSGSIRRRLLGDKRNQIQDSRHKLLAKCRLSGIRKSTKTPYINSPGYCVRERTDAYKQQYVRWL